MVTVGLAPVLVVDLSQYRELARALRLKSDLQQAVVCSGYSEKVINDTEEFGSGENVRRYEVKSILLDEHGFWKHLVSILRVATPIIVLLRLCDNQAKEIMGKVYYHMFKCLEAVRALEDESPWASEAADFVQERWDYLHGRMHAAGYALDPEFLYDGDGGPLDSHTMTGLMEVVERLSLRTIIASTPLTLRLLQAPSPRRASRCKSLPASACSSSLPSVPRKAFSQR